MKFEWFGVKIDTDKYRQFGTPRYVFKVGDHVVYPSVGIGVIQELRNICGVFFCSIQMAHGDSRIIVPMNKMKKIGITLLE
jgi:RNA polymerase-interacting CarD/CdnL/TRCF family regulator